MRQWWYNNNNLGKCVAKDGSRTCDCEPGWEGKYCTDVSCKNYDLCGKGSKNLYINLEKCKIEDGKRTCILANIEMFGKTVYIYISSGSFEYWLNSGSCCRFWNSCNCCFIIYVSSSEIFPW